MALSGGEADGVLLGCPWCPVSISGHQLLAKAWFGQTSYHVLLSDTRCVWEEKMDTASIQQRAQELNQRLRAPVQAFFSHLCEVMRPCLSGQGGLEVGAGGAQVSLTFRQDAGVHMRLKSELAGLPFYWELHYTAAPVTLVCSQLVRPLLLMSRLLQRQVDDLGALLVRKDMEIQDYRENGATLTRERLQTDGYEEDTHTQAFIAQTLPQLCSGHQDGFGFTADLQDLYRTVVAHGNKRKLSESPSLDEEDLTNQEPDRGHAPNTTLTTGVGSDSSEPIGGDQSVGLNGRGSSTDDNTTSRDHEHQSTAAPTERPSARPKKKKAVGLFR